MINFHNYIRTGFDNKNSYFISESQRENFFSDINNNILINEIIDDLKDLRKPLPKKIIVFKHIHGFRHTIRVNNDVTIDQLLRIYLRRIYRKDLINDEHNKIYFLFNAQVIKFGDNTPIEIFFKSCKNPKVILIDPVNFINFKEVVFCRELIGKLGSFLYSKSEPKIISEIITVKFNKKGKIIDINMKNDNKVGELLNEYFIKTNTKNGNFNFNGYTLFPNDIATLFESGLKNNSEIIVS